MATPKITDTVLYTIAPADLRDVQADTGVSFDAAMFVAGAIRGSFIRATGREAFYPSVEDAKAALNPGHDHDLQFVKVTFENVGSGETLN